MGVRTVCAGGAGARIDPSRIEVSDLARVKGDPLLGKLRTFLRKEYGFPAGSADGRSTLFGIPAVYSTEPLRQPAPTVWRRSAPSPAAGSASAPSSP